MAINRDQAELPIAPGLDPPVLTPAAAAVLLRILRKEDERTNASSQREAA